MLHVTCDICGKEVLTENDQHYVVNMEVFAHEDPSELTEADLEKDHLEAVSEMLREMEENELDAEEIPPTQKKFHFDLCMECHKKFVRDPLGRETAHKFDFSEN